MWYANIWCGHQSVYYYYHSILQVSLSLACSLLLSKARPVLRPAFFQVSSLICFQVSQETYHMCALLICIINL